MNRNDTLSEELPTQNQQTGEAWRQTCRDEARRTAAVEEREAWAVAEDEDGNQAIPFRHRWEHVQHVVSLALRLAEETGADPEIVEAAAWLHGVCKPEPNHGARGAVRARTFLIGTDFPPEKIDAVANAIRQHEGLTRTDPLPLSPLEAAVLWDADKLSKIGVQALMAAMSSRYMQGLPLAERRRQNQKFIETVLSQTVKSMNTKPAHTEHTP